MKTVVAGAPGECVHVAGVMNFLRLAKMLACLDLIAPLEGPDFRIWRQTHTGLNNMGAIFHPALTLLNAGRIESTHGDFQFYIGGVTPSVAGVLEVLDRERVTVAVSLGIRALGHC